MTSDDASSAYARPARARRDAAEVKRISFKLLVVAWRGEAVGRAFLSTRRCTDVSLLCAGVPAHGPRRFQIFLIQL